MARGLAPGHGCWRPGGWAEFVTIRPQRASSVERAASVAGVPRIRRSELPDGIFHVTTRGVFRRHVFTDDADRLHFLELLELVVRRHVWECHAFCLMGTHYHLVVETATDPLSAGMQYLNGEYAQRFNRRHGRDGHVFGARFSSWVIRDDDHFVRTVEYVLANPVRAGLVEDWTRWPWSAARGGQGPWREHTFGG
jgi:REP-associated tyrosine transposase